nr:hypothetical protein [Tanacetum cinerariifolium]
MDEDMGPDEQAQFLNDEDIRSAHIPKVNLRQDWWKPFEEERPATPEPAWSIRSSDVPVSTNNWASTLAVDDPILRHNVSKPLPLGGPPGQVTIQSDFFFNKDLEYLRYGSKGRRLALSISKMKAAYYPDAGLEQMVPDQFWIEEECKYDIAAIAVRTHMRILSVVRIEAFSMYGYNYIKKIVLRRADLNEHVIVERDFKLEEEKACRHGKVYNWKTATYGKIWDNEDVHDLGSVETEFPAIVFNDKLTSEATLSCELTVSSINNDEIDFRISNESGDEDFTVISDKKSFSYKIIYVNDFKTDSENDNDKVNMPLLPSPEPTVSYFDNLDFFKDFENEFPAIVYNDAQTSKSDLLAEPTLCTKYIDEFDLKEETSLSEYDEEELNILNFNDLFPFNDLVKGNRRMLVENLRSGNFKVLES